MRDTQTPPADPWLWKVPLVSFLLLIGIWLLDANRDLFLNLNSLSAYTGDFIWANLTIFGDGLVALTLCLLLFHRQPRVLWIIALSGIAVSLLTHSFKPFFDTMRPPGVIPHEFFTIIGPAYTRNSFPSGHTATIFALAGAVILAFTLSQRHLWGKLWLIFATLVGLSRIMVGVHWPLDVVAGALFGWIAAWTGWWLAARWHWGETHSGYLWLKTILVLCATTLLLSHDTHYPAAFGLQITLAAAALYAALHQPWQQLEQCFKPRLHQISFTKQKFPSLRMVCCLRKNFQKPQQNTIPTT